MSLGQTPDQQRQAATERVGQDLADRLASIELVVLDCDGVLTGGELYYGPYGEALKVFDARDGLGLILLRAAGVKRAVLTGRASTMVARRCRDLRFEAIKLARFDKEAALAEIWAETGRTAAQTLYMGDDLLDLPALVLAEVAVTVPGAPAVVRDRCHLVTRAEGGRGAVREVCDLLLLARGGLGRALDLLIDGGAP